MKQRMQGVVMGVLVTVLLLGTVTVWAATTRMIEVTFGNYMTTLFGQEFVVRNAEGAILQPFSYDGSVYIPVETVLHAMGANVQWNANTGTLNFGTATQPPLARERTPLQVAAPAYDTGRSHNFAGLGAWASDQVNMAGVTYRNVMVYGSSNATDQRVFSLHNLAGQYELLTGYIGRVDGSRGHGNAVANFYGDGNLLQSIQLNATAMPTPISISVNGVTQLRVRVTFPGSFRSAQLSGTQYALYAYLE